jgi:hypothetical protein
VSTFRRDFETVQEARQRLAREDQAEPLTVETDLGKVLEEPAARRIGPGIENVNSAFRDGYEEERIDRMRSRYGGEW